MVFPTMYDLREFDTSKACPMQRAAGEAYTQLEHRSLLNIYSQAAAVRQCGIICTIGPVSKEPEFLVKMFKTGMNIARLNFSHGTHEYHAGTIANVRTAQQLYSKELGLQAPIAIALDTKGPEIRTGLLVGGGSAEVELKTGGTIKLTTDRSYEEKGTADIVYVDYDNIQNVLKPGNRVFIDDGLMSLVCEKVEGGVLTCTIENGGKLGSKKGVNLPGVAVDLPAVSEKDKGDLIFGVQQGVDMVFASFIRNGAAVKEIRDILGAKGRNILIIPKIENHQGIENIDEIIEACDGIMIARGDMGIEIPTEKVFLAQKAIIAKCNKLGKPVICATQMLESMTYKPRPTRAEASDVANAVLDGADCTMLSGESAKGLYPLECVRCMSDVCKEAESAVYQRRYFDDLNRTAPAPVDSVHGAAIAAVRISIQSHPAAIVAVTTCARTAHLISKYRPKCPIVTVTRNFQVARQLHLYRAVVPLCYEKPAAPDPQKDVDDRVRFAINFGKNMGFLKPGDKVVLVVGWKEATGFSIKVKVVTVASSTEYEG